MPIPTHTPRLAPTRLVGALIASGALFASQAHAMNGAQLGGYGIKNAGMGGASIALPLDASAAVNNPAGMAFVPQSFAINVLVFNGQSTANTPAIPPAGIPAQTFNDNTTVSAPEGGANWVISPTMTAGISLSASGAGVDFGKTLIPGMAAANVQASQKVAEIIPSISWKVQPNLALGASVNFATQQLNSQGLVALTPLGPVEIPGYGTQTANGIGARLGVHWQASPELSVGATYKFKTNMSQLGDYSKTILQYSDGKIDLPSEYGLGLAWKASPAVTVAADYLRIEYGGIKVNQDPDGQGWKDQQVLRLGVSWDLNPSWTLRGGVSTNTRQIESDRAAQNITSPAVSNLAITAGATFKLDKTSDLSFSLEGNPSTTLDGTGSSAGYSITGNRVTVVRFGYQRSF